MVLQDFYVATAIIPKSMAFFDNFEHVKNYDAKQGFDKKEAIPHRGGEMTQKDILYIISELVLAKLIFGTEGIWK